jgi:hypothetical protein
MGVGVCARRGWGVGCGWVAELRTGGQSVTSPVRVKPANTANCEASRTSG